MILWQRKLYSTISGKTHTLYFLMVAIQTLTQLNIEELFSLVTGYTSDARYQVSKIESDGHFTLTLELMPLLRPFRKRYDPLDAETLARYRQLPALGFSFGAYDGEQCVGIALAEPSDWNKSLWVRELHVADTHQKQGVGRQLVEALAVKARFAGLRTLVCETQNTNVPAIRFYRRMGFNIEGVDLSFYTNEDFPNGEIAVFMKKRLA